MLKKAIIQVEVLYNPNEGLNPSEMSLNDVQYEMDEGSFSGISSVISDELLNIEDTVKEIEKQGSDVEFFFCDGIPEDLTTKEVNEFIDEFATEVEENEKDAYVELMMDNHKCINWGVKQYYIPEDSYSNRDQEIVEFLFNYYGV